jgi:hypothetical protein
MGTCGFAALPLALSVVCEAVVLGLSGGLFGVRVSLLVIHKLAFTIYNGDAQQNLALQFVSVTAVTEALSCRTGSENLV